MTGMRDDYDAEPVPPAAAPPKAATALDLLASILAELQGLRGDMRIAARAARGPVYASDKELDGPRAKRPILYPPKSMARIKGKKPNALDADTLEEWAAELSRTADWYDSKGDPKKAYYADSDAALARGLARRLRTAPAPVPSTPAASPAPTAPASAPVEPPEGAGDAWEPPAPAAPETETETDNDDDYS